MRPSWWRNGVFYQVYVRSFADSNDDGVGDLPGIASRLDYLKSLGLDGLWLTPFYPSPQKDHGYDVADYYGVNPEYGTLADFDHLVNEAHRRGIKVLIDIVPNHTSSRHPWFEAALSAPDDPHRTMYYFVPGKDGAPPNNWQSAFGGSAWTPLDGVPEWYLHLFAPEQPDLNWWNPAVPAEFRQIVKYWLDRGADGFRIDVAVSLYKRRDLADRPIVPDRVTGEPTTAPGFAIIDQPEVHEVYRDWRHIAGTYEPERVLVGEIFDPGRQARYIKQDELHMAFAMLDRRWEAALWKKAIDVYRRAVSHGTSLPSWTQSNHDVLRHVTRLGGDGIGRQRAKASALLLLGLPGQYFIYQGEELGLEEVVVPPERREDPLYIRTNGRHQGRDGCRVPLPWREHEPNAGFSTSPPWLPMPAGWDRYAVDAQARSSTSMLSLYRRLLAVRRGLAPRLTSRMAWATAPNDCLIYHRGPLSVACNFSHRPLELDLPGRLLIGSSPGVRRSATRLLLPPNSAAWLETRRPAGS
ncbi:MAG TPA: alpha-amylase family glycosyl hydrolase [Candidatus Dormibacteraeota bacterium]|nr:alpha-amylase family glycosyl hydrolase [Candidatus Dormibacteraeota bacterium]